MLLKLLKYVLVNSVVFYMLEGVDRGFRGFRGFIQGFD